MLEYFCWSFVFIAFAVFVTRVKGMDKPDWYIVIKYTDGDYLGELVDAHFVTNSADALYRTSLGPMRPGEKLRGFWIRNDDQRLNAIRLHELRAKANRDFELLMQHIEDRWSRAQHGVV
jgi:hypothetical protein